MNPWLIIVQRARLSLIFMGTVVLFSLALILASAYLENSLRADLKQRQSETGSLHSNVNAKRMDLSFLEEHIDLFRALVKQGLTRSPDRESWVEHLLSVRRDLHLPDTLAYSLPPASALTTEGTASTPAPVDAAGAPPSDVPLTHDLEISLHDIHEKELLTLLSHFQAVLDERFRVQHCRLYGPTPTGLIAECTLRFFTLQQANETPARTTP